jgi:archaemetzincin
MRPGDDGRAIEAVRLVGFGPLPPGCASGLASHVSRRVTAPCRWETSGPGLELPRLSNRDQVDADRLLERLESEAVPPGTVMVGVTGLDIAIPIFTFVFGRARSLGHAALVSTARLDSTFYGLPADAERTLRRTADEVLHELGHVAGLRHCREAACLMRFAGSVEQADVRGSVFCGSCAAWLPRGLR